MTHWGNRYQMTPEQEMYEAAQVLAGARVRYAQRFMLAKGRGKDVTDGFAHQAAIEDTGDDITLRQAEYDIAKIKFEKS